MLWEACLLWEAFLLRLCSDLVYCLLTLGDVYSNSQRESRYFTLKSSGSNSASGCILT